MTINPVENRYGRLTIDSQSTAAEKALQEDPEKKAATSTAISMGDVVSISDEGKSMAKAQVHYASKKMLGTDEEEEETDSTESVQERMEEIQKEMQEVQQELQKVMAEEGNLEEKNAKVKELQNKLQMLQTELTELMDSLKESA